MSLKVISQLYLKRALAVLLLGLALAVRRELVLP